MKNLKTILSTTLLIATMFSSIANATPSTYRGVQCTYTENDRSKLRHHYKHSTTSEIREWIRYKRYQMNKCNNPTLTAAFVMGTHHNTDVAIRNARLAQK